MHKNGIPYLNVVQSISVGAGNTSNNTSIRLSKRISNPLSCW